MVFLYKNIQFTNMSYECENIIIKPEKVLNVLIFLMTIVHWNISGKPFLTYRKIINN